MLDHSRGQELLVKDALHIQMTPSDERFNRDGGLEVPGILDRCVEESGRGLEFPPPIHNFPPRNLEIEYAI